MPTLELPDSPVGRLFVPEISRVTFNPGRTTGRSNRYVGVVTYRVRDGQTRRMTQAGYGIAVECSEGLLAKWQRNEELQRIYPTPEAMLAALKYRARYGNVPLPSGIVHNERVNNGGAMLGAAFFGNSLSPTHATVNAPNRIALCNLNTFAVDTADQSLGTHTADVTTNEQTANGLGRTGAITPTSVVAESTADGNIGDHVVNTFTDTTATSTTYGSGLFDNTTSASNMFAEATYSTAVTNTGDTLQVDWHRLS